jgi:hypothetical protein
MSKKVSTSGTIRKPMSTVRVGRTVGSDSAVKPVSVKPKSIKPVVASKPVVTEEAVVESFTQAFGFPVRLYWNLRLESENSSCAKAGTELSFETISMKGKQTIYRVRRGKRNFFTTTKELTSK